MRILRAAAALSIALLTVSAIPAAAAGPKLSVKDKRTSEAAKTINFKVTLNKASAKDIKFDYRTIEDTALAGDDYMAKEGTLRIPAGETEKVIKVPLVRDLVEESDEDLKLRISQPVNATIDDAVGRGTITDEDAAVGEVIITELMANPAELDEAGNEYVEIVNADTGPVNLAGWVLADDDSDVCVLTGSIPVDTHVVLSTSTEVSDISCAPSLQNTADTVTLLDGSVLSEESLVRDQVTYSSTTPATSRQLHQLLYSVVTNDNEEAWCSGTSVYSTSGNKGTPGELNNCPSG